MKQIYLFQIFLSLTICVSCLEKNNEKVLLSGDLIRSSKIISDSILSKDNIDVFSISIIDRRPEGKGADYFVSVSDICNDSLLIPQEIIRNQKKLSFEEKRRVELKGEFRKRLFDCMKFSENDTLYLKNYETGLLTKHAVSALKSVAYINPYLSEEDEIQSYYYMVGFELGKGVHEEKPEMQLNNAVAVFGKKNPFSEGKLMPVKWEQIPVNTMPSELFRKSDTLKAFRSSKMKIDDVTLYVQEFNDENTTVMKRMVAKNAGGETVFAETIELEEGEEFYPMNGLDDQEYVYQFTGRLFKNKPNVIMTFTSQSFGCETINFLGKNLKPIIINCDNRH